MLWYSAVMYDAYSDCRLQAGVDSTKGIVLHSLAEPGTGAACCLACPLHFLQKS